MNIKIQVPVRLLAAAATAAASWGCAVATESETSEISGVSDEIVGDEIVDTAPEADSAWAEGTESQKAATYTTFLQDASKFETNSVASTGKLCVVSAIWGDTHGWRGIQRGFELKHTSTDTWGLQVYGLAAQVGGTCVNRSAFQVPSGGVVEVGAGVTTYAGAFTYRDTEYSSGDTAGFLSGFAANRGDAWGIPLSFDGGGFEGMGEMVRVSQSNSVSSPHVLRADVGHVGRVVGFADSFRAGVATQRPHFYGYKDGSMIRARWGASGTNFSMNISTFNGYSAYWMAQTQSAICVMTRYQGRLAGTDGRVRAFFQGTQWKSEIKSSHQAEATYRCMAYYQR